jgi:simple sugar transport system ATP-binding protein
MDEVLASADRITILRQGKNVAVLDNKNIDRNTLSRLIVDREVFFNYEKPESVLGEPVLRVSDVSHVDSSGVQVLKGVNLSVRLGEIVGICGVAGNGQKELVEALIGVRPVSGKILFNGMDVTNLPTDKRRALGMAYIPEDFSEGLVLDFKLYENVALPPKLSSMLTGGVWLKLRKLKEVVWRLMLSIARWSTLFHATGRKQALGCLGWPVNGLQPLQQYRADSISQVLMRQMQTQT